MVDERATDEQREALQTIMSGGDTEEMATMFWIYSAMSPNKHDTLYKRLDMEIDIEARTGEVTILATEKGKFVVGVCVEYV